MPVGTVTRSTLSGEGRFVARVTVPLVAVPVGTVTRSTLSGEGMFVARVTVPLDQTARNQRLAGEVYSREGVCPVFPSDTHCKRLRTL